MSDIKDFSPDSAAKPGEPTMDSQRSRPVTKHDIEVKAVANGGTIDWEVDGKKPDKSELKFERDSGAHEIKFDLDRDLVLKHRGLRFNCANPIFVHNDLSICPTSGVDEQIEVHDCSRDSLTIYDKNLGSQKRLRYQLNFVEDDGAASVCDPIIDNGGGR